MKTKKILFLAIWFLPRVGGMEVSSSEIVKIIKSIDADIQVVTSDHDEAEQFDKIQNFVIRRAKGMFLQNLAEKNKMKRLYNYFVYYKKYYSEVNRAIQEFQPDEILVADEQTRNWYGFYANKIPFEPIVVASMPEKKEETLKIRIIRRTLVKAKAVYCVSSSTKEKMCDAFGDEFRSKMHVLYRSISSEFIDSPVDQSAVAEIKDKYKIQNKFVILSVCRLNHKKNVSEVITALYKLGNRAKDMVLLVCGEGTDKQRLEELIYQYHIEDRVVLCGKVDHEEIKNYYDVCDIFVLPSVEESFGRVYVEAGARCKASIGCKIGGVEEVIDDMKTGCLIEPNDVEKLAEYILKLKNEKEFRNELENNMYRKVMEQFSFAALRARWKTILGIK